MTKVNNILKQTNFLSILSKI